MERLHEIRYTPGFGERLKNFRSHKNILSLKMGDLIISYVTPDGVPTNARLNTTDAKNMESDTPTTFENTYFLYQAAREKDPEHPLVRPLRDEVLHQISMIERELNSQIESAEILRAQLLSGNDGPGRAL